jgi:hypothetical protein
VATGNWQLATGNWQLNGSAASIIAAWRHGERTIAMEIKVFQASAVKNLEADVNAFIGKKDIKVLELQYSTTIFSASVMIVYENCDGS